MRKKHLVLFVKAPRWGQVKTRLARDIGQMSAWMFYRNTSCNVLRRLVRDGRWQTILAVTPDEYVAKGRFWPSGARRMAQGRGDLGRRMSGPLKTLPPGPVVIIGSDIPDITPDHVARAFKALGRAEAVIGPAEDGGYWLVGLKRSSRIIDLFKNVRWSGPETLRDTVRNMPRTARITCIDTLRDVDTGKDYMAIVRAGAA